LRAVAINDVADATVNSVERLIPGDSLELARAFCTNALKWMAQAVRAVNEFGIVIGYFGTNGTVGNGIDLRAAHGDKLIACNRH
jgi:hypothetical protein